MSNLKHHDRQVAGSLVCVAFITCWLIFAWPWCCGVIIEWRLEHGAQYSRPISTKQMIDWQNRQKWLPLPFLP